MGTRTGLDAPIEAVLDSGAVGLRYFADFLPRADRVRPQSTSVEQLYARYDEQRGLDTAALLADADTMKRALDVIDEQLGDQSDRTRALDSSWSGDAADSARAFAGRHLQRAQRDRDAMVAAQAAIQEAARALRLVITDKADTVADFPGRIDGKGPAEVDAIIRAATLTCADGQQSLLGVVVEIFSDLLPAAGSLITSAILDRIAERCRQWLDEVFVPHVDEYLRTYDELCTVTDEAVRDIYARLAAALDAVDDSPYPAPGDRHCAVTEAPTCGPSQPAPQQVPAAPVLPAAPVPTPAPAPVSPSGIAPVAPPSPQVPQFQAPQFQTPQMLAPQLSPQPLFPQQSADGLGALVGELTKNLVGVVTEAITSGVEQLHADGDVQEPPPVEKPDDDVEKLDDTKPSDEKSKCDEKAAGREADFDVDGSHLHFEQQADGKLALDVTGPSKTFDLSVDDDDAPIIAEPSAPEPHDAAPESSKTVQPDADSGELCEPHGKGAKEPSGAEPALNLQSPGRRESRPSGEPQLATTMPDGGADSADGTGALLAEAGPL